MFYFMGDEPDVGFNKDLELELCLGEFMETNKEEIEKLRKENKGNIIEYMIEYLKEAYIDRYNSAVKHIIDIMYFLLNFKYMPQDQKEEDFRILDSINDIVDHILTDEQVKKDIFKFEDSIMNSAYDSAYCAIFNYKHDIEDHNIDVDAIPIKRDKAIYNLTNILNEDWRYQYLYENSILIFKKRYEFMLPANRKSYDRLEMEETLPPKPDDVKLWEKSMKRIIYRDQDYALVSVIGAKFPDKPFFRFYYKDKMCRISLLCPEYLKMEGDDLILNQEQKVKLMEILKLPNKNYPNIDNWNAIIIAHNSLYREYFKYNTFNDKLIDAKKIKDILLGTLSIPDYTKLAEK